MKDQAKTQGQLMKELAKLRRQLASSKAKLNETQEALQECETRLGQVEKASEAICWIMSPDWRELNHVSPAFERIYGHPSASLYEQPGLWLEAIHPEDRDRVLALVASYHGQEAEMEYRIVRPDRETRWIRARVLPVLDQEGQLSSITGVLDDVTERRRTEEALRESEARFRVIFETARDRIFIKDRARRYTYVNPAMEELTGLPASELMGKRLEEIPGVDADGSLEESEGRVLNGETLTEEHISRVKGPPFTSHVVRVPLRNAAGEVVGLCGISRDITELKRAELALRESERRYRSLFDNVPVGLYLTTPGGRILDANPALVQMLGYPDRESLLAVQTFDSYVDPQVRAEWQARMEREGIVRNIEQQLRRRDGSVIWVEESSRATCGADGRVLYYEGRIEDITERRRTEEALRDSEARFRVIFETARDRIFIKDRDRRFTYVNPAMEELTGLPASKLMGKRVEDLLGENAGEYVEDVDRLVLKGETIAEEHTSPFQGSSFTSHVIKVPMRNKVGEVVGLCGISRDITAFKRAEEALRESERRYRLLAENVSDVIGTTDSNLRVTYVSPSVTSVSGYSVAEVMELGLENLLTPRSIEAARGLLQEITAQQGPGRSDAPESRRLELEFKRKEGSTVWTEAHIAIIRDRDGRPVEDLGVIRDIGDRKRWEESLREYRGQLQALASELSVVEERERRRISSGLHDRVGQALALAKIKLGALAELAPSSSEFADRVEEIRRVLDRTIQDTRSLIFELSPPILYELGLEAALEWLGEQVQAEHGITVVFSDDGRPKPVGDDLRAFLFRAVRELLVNVVKHANAKSVEVCTRLKDEQITIVVEDDGNGFTISETLPSEARHRGFGLFSIREQVSRLGGHMTVGSGASGGARVELVAPLSGC